MSLILGIESSCDETAAAVVEDGRTVLSNAVASQIAKHAAHGGVVPELAAREHLTALTPTLNESLAAAGIGMADIDAVAVTQGPGLMPALLVGLNFAKGLATGYGKPLIGVNHFLAHIYAAFLESGNNVLTDPAAYPLLALVVSGGHTSLMLIDREGNARQLGCTIDDAAGEALDKASKLLGLGYPGGPIIQRTAETGKRDAWHFPRPLTGAAGKPVSPENRYNFSFSGIKTALLYHVRNTPEAERTSAWLADTAASYQEAVVDVLVRKTLMAAKDFSVRSIVVSGGVACNTALRERFTEKVPKHVALHLAERKFCTDNGAMVGGCGYHYFRKREFAALDIDSFARLPQITKVPFL